METSSRHSIEITADTSQAKSAIDSTEKELDNLDKKAKRSGSSIGAELAGVFAGLTRNARNVGSLWAATIKQMSQNKGVTKNLKKEYDELSQQIRRLGTMQVRTPEFKDIQDKIRRATRSITELKKEQERMMSGGNVPHLKRYDDLVAKIKKTKAEVEDLSAKLAKDLTNKKLGDQIERAKAKLEQYKAKQDQMITNGTHEPKKWRDIKEQIAAAQSKLNEYIDKRDELRSAGKDYEPVSSDNSKEMANLQSRKAEVEAAMSETEGRGKTLAAFLIATIGGAILRGIGNAFKDAFSKIKSGLSSIANGVKGVINKIKEWRKETLSVKKAAETTYKTFTSYLRMMRNRLRRTIVGIMFNDFKERLHEIANFSPRFNAAMSSMILSFKTLGAQIIASIEPLVVAISPIITVIVDKLTIAAQRIAQLIASVSGSDTWLKALKGQYDYAASVDNTTKSTKKATKAAKEYENTVLSFDQLHKLNGDKSTESDVGFDFENLNYEEADTLLSRLYRAIKDKDWKGVGSIMSEGLNMAFSWLKDNLGWEANAERITNFLEGFKDTINNFIEGFDGLANGEAFGDIFNTLIGVFNNLTDPDSGIDFDGLGEKIGDFIKGAIQKIHWNELGQTLINGIQGLVRAITGVLTGSEGKSLMATIGEAFRNLFIGIAEAFDPDDWSDFFAEIINGITSFITELLSDQVKIMEFSWKIGDMINQIFDKIDATQLAEAISSLARTFTTVVRSIFYKIDWWDVITTLWNVLKQLDWSSVGDAVGMLMIPSLIKGLFRGGGGLLGSLLGGGGGGGGGLLGSLLGGGGGGGILGGALGKVGSVLAPAAILGAAAIGSVKFIQWGTKAGLSTPEALGVAQYYAGAGGKGGITGWYEHGYNEMTGKNADEELTGVFHTLIRTLGRVEDNITGAYGALAYTLSGKGSLADFYHEADKDPDAAQYTRGGLVNGFLKWISGYNKDKKKAEEELTEATENATKAMEEVAEKLPNSALRIDYSENRYADHAEKELEKVVGKVSKFGEEGTEWKYTDDFLPFHNQQRPNSLLRIELKPEETYANHAKDELEKLVGKVSKFDEESTGWKYTDDFIPVDKRPSNPFINYDNPWKDETYRISNSGRLLAMTPTFMNWQSNVDESPKQDSARVRNALLDVIKDASNVSHVSLSDNPFMSSNQQANYWRNLASNNSWNSKDKQVDYDPMKSPHERVLDFIQEKVAKVKEAIEKKKEESAEQSLSGMISDIPNKMSEFVNTKLEEVKLDSSTLAASDGDQFTTSFIEQSTNAETAARQGQVGTADKDGFVDDIVGGIRDIVWAAVATLQEGDGGDIVLRIDSEDVARANARGQRRISKRNNPVVALY